MPRLLVFLMGLFTLAVSSTSGEQTFPYKACVMVDGTEIHSGPGKSYYPTDKLQKGDYLEVYRHDPGGWCAVKPPEGSYTWIAGQYLKLQDQNLAVVTEDDVAACVGSRLSNDRDVIQVHMRKGETVEILGVREILREREIPGNNSQIWYKIAPPAGEFRWVLKNILIRSNPARRRQRIVPATTPERIHPMIGARKNQRIPEAIFLRRTFRPSWIGLIWSCR